RAVALRQRDRRATTSQRVGHAKASLTPHPRTLELGWVERSGEMFGEELERALPRDGRVVGVIAVGSVAHEAVLRVRVDGDFVGVVRARCFDLVRGNEEVVPAEEVQMGASRRTELIGRASCRDSVVYRGRVGC